MNNYPTWWNTTITIFNKYIDSDTHMITWVPHVINNCFGRFVGNRVVVGETVIESDTVVCRIPVSDKYVEKSTWDNLLDKTEYFTLAQGDIIVRGEIPDTINEYTQGQRSSDLLNKYRKSTDCMQIDRFAINVSGGRGVEHYYIRGI